MKSRTFAWLTELPDEQAYEFLGEVIDAASTAGTRTQFLAALDDLVTEWRDVRQSPDSPGAGPPLRRSSPLRKLDVRYTRPAL